MVTCAKEADGAMSDEDKKRAAHQVLVAHPDALRPSTPGRREAPIEDGLRATRRMQGTLTRERTVDAEDMRELLSTGVSPQQVEDALAVCAAFNTTDRLADAFGFELLSPAACDAGAKYLLRRGYR
jgi:hypothetical protein